MSNVIRYGVTSLIKLTFRQNISIVFDILNDVSNRLRALQSYFSEGKTYIYINQSVGYDWEIYVYVSTHKSGVFDPLGYRVILERKCHKFSTSFHKYLEIIIIN